MEESTMDATGSNKPKEGKEKINLRILIAEDDKDIGPMLVFMLSRMYSSVELVTNGQSLIDKLEAGDNYDFIITDNNMHPGITGLEAIKKIRKKGGYLKTIPIILYTTDTTGSLKEDAKAEGAAFLWKPSPINEISAKIEELKLEKSSPGI